MVDRHYSLNLKPWSATTLYVYADSAQKYSVGLQAETYFPLPCGDHDRTSNFKNFLGEYSPRPTYSCMVYVGHACKIMSVMAIPDPSNILSHRKIPFQKIPPPPGKFLKKALVNTLNPHPPTKILFYSTNFTSNLNTLHDKH